MKESICKTCEHYSLDKYNNHGCGKRGAFSNEYGRFENGANCVFDVSWLKNHYSPLSEENSYMAKLVKENLKVKDDNYYLKKDIEELKETIHILSKGK